MFDDLEYKKETGQLVWKNNRGTLACKGKVAGYKHAEGYLMLEYKGKGYLQHRIVWYLHHAAWPKGEIDHINGNKADNRIENLRDVPKRTNLTNTHKHRAGKLPGTYYQKKRKSWRARYRYKGKEFYLGEYPSQEEAHMAYIKAIKNLIE